ncbi:MAG: uroporphyrinogen decarboxylase family protein, partial [Candidatus Hermodarchaeota archaeon]
YPIKSLDDIKIMRYLLENTEFFFSNENYQLANKQFGDLGVPSTYLMKSPYQKLVTELMGFTRTILFLKKYPSQVENFMIFLDLWDDEMYNQISKSPLQIVNFGENLDSNLSPPHYFEKYLLPYYEKRVKQFHQADKYCHIHMDGSLRDFLPYFEHLPFDGFEALTAEPQGDVKLEEIKDVIGNKILLDGIPSILFLSEYDYSYLEAYTQKVLELFSPHLILGISDELSPNGDIRKIEKLKELVNQFNLRS